MTEHVAKICVVSSCGGHLTEARVLRPVYEVYQYFYVINERISLPADMRGRTYFISHAERDWRILVNLWEAWSILRRERPRVILSTGAGPAVPFALVGRLLGIPSVFIEAATQVWTPSVTGRIMYWLASRFFYQWPQLKQHFPKGSCGGPLAWSL